MKRLLVFLVVAIVTVSLGFTTYAFVKNKEEILFFTTTSKDIYSSILISLITSAIISLMFWIIGQGEEISKITTTAPLIVKIIIAVIWSVGLLSLVTYLFKTLINVHNERKKLSDYEILCAKEYEITKIDDILAKRFENHKKEVEAKPKKTE